MNQQSMSSAAKAVGISLAVGTAAAVMSTAMKSGSKKHKAKKVMKKAANTLGGIVDEVQYMVK